MPPEPQRVELEPIEVMRVRESGDPVDDIEIGVGPVTREIQKAYLATVNGLDDRWGSWLDVVDTARARASAGA